MKQNILSIYERACKRIQTAVDDKSIFNYKQVLDERLKKMEEKAEKISQLNLRRKEISNSYNDKINRFEFKLSQSMEKSQHIKEQKLLIRVKKLKKQNKRSPHPKENEEQHIPRIQEAKKQMSTPEYYTHKSRDLEEKLEKIILRKKLIDEEYFDGADSSFNKLYLRVEEAEERRLQQLNGVKERVNKHNQEVVSHYQRSVEMKQNEETQKMDQLLNKLQHLSFRQQESDKKNMKLQKVKQKSLKNRRNTIASNRLQLLEEQKKKNIAWLNKTQFAPRSVSTKHSDRTSQVKLRLSQYQQWQDQKAQEILEKHFQIKERNRIKHIIENELANTQQYFNFTIKE